jgi:hypothetical protein
VSAPKADVPAKPERLSGFKLQPDLPTANSCSVDDLLRYHDRIFVEHVYNVIAKRHPTTSEMASTLADLRNGDKSKVEIIEAVVAAQKEAGMTVDVTGLPSPTLRKLGRWPVVGPFFRVLRGVARLPLMMQNQQRFENYTMAQQQRLADFLNERVLPEITIRQSNGGGETNTTVADIVESVMMLSDSVVELAAKQSELSQTLLETQERSVHISSQLTTVEEAQRQLQSQTELLAKELHAQIASLVEQRTQSESTFRNDLVNLTQAIQELQSQYQKQAQALEEHAASQREFLIQEQRQIVETQKVALSELQTQITETEERSQATLTSLAGIVQRLREVQDAE